MLSKSESQTQASGSQFAKKIKKFPCLIILDGPVGAGKTTWVKGFVRGYLGKSNAVSSPSYSFINSYKVGKKEVIHADFYRLKNADDLESLGFWDILKEKKIVIVEWGDPFDLSFNGTQVIKVKIAIRDENQRELTYE
jgi:tRNA threonylcarbamoyladenosine biosynthesis protein TsaE